MGWQGVDCRETAGLRFTRGGVAAVGVQHHGGGARTQDGLAGVGSVDEGDEVFDGGVLGEETRGSRGHGAGEEVVRDSWY